MIKFHVLSTLNLILLLMSTAWLGNNWGWEPAVTSLALFITYIGSYFREQTPKKNHIQLPSDDDAFKHCVHLFIDNDSEIKKVQMIQCSGDMVKGILNKLLKKHIQVELLLQHPDQAINGYQWNKMKVFRDRIKSDFPSSSQLEVRYYRDTASLRAIKLGNKYLALSWYVYRDRLTDKVVSWLYGHRNPNIVVSLDKNDTQPLKLFFDEQFDYLWNNAVTYDKVNFADKYENQLLRS